MRGTNVNKHGKTEKNQKVKEGDCIFPFKYQWKETMSVSIMMKRVKYVQPL